MLCVPKLINAVVLLILLTALSDPEQYHLTSAELAHDLDVMDDASKLLIELGSLVPSVSQRVQMGVHVNRCTEQVFFFFFKYQAQWIQA